MLSLIQASTTTNISLPMLTVVQRAADSIQAVDESANLRVQDGTITWLSADLLESVTISFIELNDTTCVWADHLECDAPIVAAAFQHLEASLSHPVVPEEEASSIHQATVRLMADETFNDFVEVSKFALKGAADSPYRSVKRYTEVMSKLPTLAYGLRTRKGVSPDTLAEECGLGAVFRDGISWQAKTKFKGDHEFRHDDRLILSQYHVTLSGGAGCNDAAVMSIHLAWDAKKCRLIVLMIGRHTRSVGTRT
jgi:hypothetical protein